MQQDKTYTSHFRGAWMTHGCHNLPELIMRYRETLAELELLQNETDITGDFSRVDEDVITFSTTDEKVANKLSMGEEEPHPLPLTFFNLGKSTSR